MKHIIYGYDQEAFNRAALAHVEKLTFNTRSEYLAWVKQWKEDYRCLSVARRIERLNRYTTQPKIDRANKLIEKLNVQCPNEKYTEIVDRLANLSMPAQYRTDYGIKFLYWKPSTYNLLMYLLVVRKASKLRAAVKRATRIAAEKAVA